MFVLNHQSTGIKLAEQGKDTFKQTNIASVKQRGHVPGNKKAQNDSRRAPGD